MGKNIIGGEKISKEEPQDRKNVSDVHIGVFFEGSGLNMEDEVFNDSTIIFFRKKRRSGSKNYVDSAKDITPEMLCDIEEDRKSNGFTNVSMLFTLFDGGRFGDDNPNNKIYIEGAGTTDVSSDSNKKYGIEGFASGDGETGVTALVFKAAKKVTEYVNSVSEATPEETNLHFYVFGFSRGATCSRLFCHLLTSYDEVRCEEKFSAYKAGTLGKYKSANKITVDFVGLYDTVSSIGYLKRKDGSTPATIAGGIKGTLNGAKTGWGVGGVMGVGLIGGLAGALKGGIAGALGGGIVGALEGASAASDLSEWHYDNVKEYGLYINTGKYPDGTRKIQRVCHICAMDEFRENFALVNLGKNIPENAVEIMIPGCHCDVGGSYLNKPESVYIRKHKLLDKEAGAYYISYIPSHLEPLNSDDVGIVGEASFRKSGWINSNTKIEKDNDHCIEILRKVTRGYSDIPLAMMRTYFSRYFGEGCFKKIPVEHNYQEFEPEKDFTDLKNAGDWMERKMKQVSMGQRYWFIPKEDDDYKSLRSKYLHFSSKDYLFNLSELSFLGSNSPNYNEDDVMCRITYHGDKDEQCSGTEKIHYMYELYNDRKDKVDEFPFSSTGSDENSEMCRGGIYHGDKKKQKNADEVVRKASKFRI